MANTDTELPTQWALEIGVASEPGVRAENQDRLTHFQSQFGHVLMLADGMGGHRGGALASSMATTRLEELLDRLPPSTTPEQALRTAIQDLSKIIFTEAEAGGEETRGMGSTVVVLLIRASHDGPMAIGAHIGDSRLYFLRAGQLQRLTRDHTVVERLIEKGVLTQEAAQRHPQAGVLTRALGVEANPEVELTSWLLAQVADRFLLCSDGLSSYVAETEIRKILDQNEPPEELARQLAALALDSGTKDNVSVLVCGIAVQPV